MYVNVYQNHYQYESYLNTNEFIISNITVTLYDYAQYESYLNTNEL